MPNIMYVLAIPVFISWGILIYDIYENRGTYHVLFALFVPSLVPIRIVGVIILGYYALTIRNARRKVWVIALFLLGMGIAFIAGGLTSYFNINI